MVESGDVGKAGLFTIGIALIGTGANFVSGGQVVNGAVTICLGFGCILIGVWWTEKQIVSKIKKSSTGAAQ